MCNIRSNPLYCFKKRDGKGIAVLSWGNLTKSLSTLQKLMILNNDSPKKRIWKVERDRKKDAEKSGKWGLDRNYVLLSAL